MERINKDRKYAFKPSKYADVCNSLINGINGYELRVYHQNKDLILLESSFEFVVILLHSFSLAVLYYYLS